MRASAVFDMKRIAGRAVVSGYRTAATVHVPGPAQRGAGQVGPTLDMAVVGVLVITSRLAVGGKCLPYFVAGKTGTQAD